ncbi:hypothetical protein BZA77DRAFT_303534 [Pyronema omphalodes]|nr:hypothetical protein BZA77DRAFT_303534 [Pyronema omphalodes]
MPMPIIRNPFRRTQAPPPQPPPLLNSSSSSVVETLSSIHSGQDQQALKDNATRSTSALNVKNDDEKNTYKMSVVNDSGVYLPPSPVERKSFWKRESSSSSSKNRPPIQCAPDEQFTISRESFDSYRRSFDISARSPISDVASGRTSFDARPYAERHSMDVRPSTGRMSLDVPPRMSLDGRPKTSYDRQSPRLAPVKVVEEPEDEFEEVKLVDDTRPKKHSIFSRFGGDHGNKDAEKDPSRPRSMIFSRKDNAIEAAHEAELARIMRED